MILTNPLVNPIEKRPTSLLLKFLTNLTLPESHTKPSKILSHQLEKAKVFHIKKGNLLLFLTMRVQCKIARKDEKYLQDYCVRVA